jgi:hypothetical protein
MATWNIVNGKVGKLKQVAARLVQMGIEVEVLTETKFVNNWYPKSAMVYTIMCSKVVSCTQGGVALVWKENNLRFKVELGLFHCPNTLTFQLTMGDEQFYCVRLYIPPNCTRGVEDIRQAAEACLVGCKLLVMGDLNINVGFPHDKGEEFIVNLLNKMCLVDLLHGYQLWTPCRTVIRV